MNDSTVRTGESYEQLLEKITALSRGFLMVLDEEPIEKRCSFCRGLLILFDQMHTISHGEN